MSDDLHHLVPEGGVPGQAERSARDIKKHLLVLYKGGKCNDCGGVFPDICYDFDHQDPAKKKFCLSDKMSLGIEHLVAEADKCDLVCTNCHRIRTHSIKTKNGLAAARARDKTLGRPAKLAAHKAEVIRLKASGHSLRAIGRQLGMSECSVRRLAA